MSAAAQVPTGKTQLAARYHGPNDLRVEPVAVYPPLPNCVAVKVAFCGICGSDLHFLQAGHPGLPEDFIEPISGERGPCTLGHEFAGTVVGFGEDVAKLVAEKKSPLFIGARVAAEALWYCGECPECKAGATNVCRETAFHGYGRNGGFQAVVNSRANLLHILPDSLTFEQGALVEVLATAWHAVDRAGFKKGQTALVLGAGPIGSFVIRILQYLGASYLAVSEPSAKRAASAKAIGCTVFDPRKDNVSEAIKKATDGGGVDVVFECSGVQAAMEDAFKCVKRRGTLLTLAAWEPAKPAKIDPTVMLTKEFMFHGTLAYTSEDYEAVIALMASGEINTEGLVTGCIPLCDIQEKGFTQLITDPGDHIKVLVDPSATPTTNL